MNRRLLVLAASLCLLLASCGLKPGVELTAGGGGTGSAGGGGAVDGTGTAAGTDGAAAGDPGSPGAVPGATGGGATGTAGGTGSAGGSSGGAGGGATATTRAGATGGGGTGGATGAGDRTGIDDAKKVIRIGIHAPVTGAAPIQQTSFESGRKVYWDFLKDKGGLFGGYTVEVFFEDDEFNPAVAVQKCRKMVEQNKVFLLVGGGGADQITACAKYANSINVPYLSAGVNEEGLTGLKTYFATSQTYSQQSPLLAQLVKNQFGGKTSAVLVADSAPFNDAYRSIKAELGKLGVTIAVDKRINKNLSQGEAIQLVNEMRGKMVANVYFLASPTSFINLAQQGQGQGFVPQYVGPGLTSGLNTVTNLGCPGVGKANFLSPFPQLDAIDRLDPDFKPAYQKYTGNAADDIGIALWGLNKSLGVSFAAAGKDMTRQSFMATLESGKRFETGVYPPVTYGPGKHFGAASSHLLEADCGSRTYKTKTTFASGF
jgi:branched-chain amino acid transport system substrate-binding protein